MMSMLQNVRIYERSWRIILHNTPQLSRMFEYVGVMLIVGLTDKLTLKLATPL